MRIAVAGAGAIGTWLGAGLARAGHDVALLGRGAHGEAIGEGVRVRGAETYDVQVKTALDGPVDLVIATVKAHDLPGLEIPPDAPVLAAQNGIPWWYFHPEPRRLESVTATIDPARAIGLVVYMGAAIGPPGTVNVRPEAGLVIGEPANEITPRLTKIADALEEAGFPVRRSTDIRTDIWTKLMGNAAFNPISMLTGAGLGSIATHPGTRAVVTKAMEEAVAIARAVGANPTISIPDRLAVTERLGEHKTSTLQDLEAGKRVELDAILAAPVELARMTNTPAPTLELLLALADLQARRLNVR